MDYSYYNNLLVATTTRRRVCQPAIYSWNHLSCLLAIISYLASYAEPLLPAPPPATTTDLVVVAAGG
jgi:hypothetical protein